MSFSAINEDRRIYINLSEYAQSIIEDDMRSFLPKKPKKEMTESSFINTIFKNYRDAANASISIRKQEYAEQLKQQLYDNSSSQKETIIVQLSDYYANTLFEETKMYKKGKSKKYKLQTENLEYLMDEDCTEDIYYKINERDSIPLYLKAIIEEYCYKTYVERERIYYKDIIDKIKQAIPGKTGKNKTDRKMLSLQLDNNEQIKIKPYDITPNSIQSYNYLVGYAVYPSSPNYPNEYPISIRLSRIYNVKSLGTSAFISAQKKAELVNLIKTRDIAFLSTREESFTVRLTDYGIKKYNSIHHMRPMYIEKIDEHTYTFRCPKNQFQFYFFKFGSDAEVLSPPDVREQFKTMYLNALDIYN